MNNPKDRRTLAAARTFIAYPQNVMEAAYLMEKLLEIIEQQNDQIKQLETDITELEDEKRSR